MHDPEPAANSAQSDILKIVLIYAVFAGLWILLSDEAVAWRFVDSTSFHIPSTLKGWFFVAITSTLFYLLLNKPHRSSGNGESIHRSALVNWKTWQLYLFAVAATLFTLLLRRHTAPLFIQDLTIENPEGEALIETIPAVAKLMHVKVVAEGVETAEQAAFLNQRGHVIHQGYLFGRPEHAETVIANIAKSGL